MLRYIIGRLLGIIPLFVGLAVTLLLLFKSPANDPVERILLNRGIYETELTTHEYNQIYKEQMHLLGLDRPPFYFSILPNFVDNDIYQVFPLKKREALLKGHGFYYPTMRFYGLENQFHDWITHAVKGDFGYSSISGEQVSGRISNAFFWTVLLGFLSLALAVLLALIFLFISQQAIMQSIVELLADITRSIPLFVFATVVLVMFTTSIYGDYLNIFEMKSFYALQGSTGVHRVLGAVEILALPICCFGFWMSMALYRLLVQTIQGELNKGYVLMARSKGLTEQQILRRHILPNVMIPFSTILINTSISILSGSILLEVIFNIPGVGRLFYEATLSSDWNLIFSIVLLLALLTALLYLLGDLLYKFLDPRIHFE